MKTYPLLPEMGSCSSCVSKCIPRTSLLRVVLVDLLGTYVTFDAAVAAKKRSVAGPAATAVLLRLTRYTVTAALPRSTHSSACPPAEAYRHWRELLRLHKLPFVQAVPLFERYAKLRYAQQYDRCASLHFGSASSDHAQGWTCAI
jgi:hypothetical protein